jgi:K+-transporting ATPase KdpF subunit
VDDGSRVRTALTGDTNMEYLIAGLISLGLCMYLLYALLKPEKF